MISNLLNQFYFPQLFFFGGGVSVAYKKIQSIILSIKTTNIEAFLNITTVILSNKISISLVSSNSLVHVQIYLKNVSL